MKKIKRTMASYAAVVLTLMAASVATSACFWGFYQPEEPKCLRED